MKVLGSSGGTGNDEEALEAKSFKQIVVATGGSTAPAGGTPANPTLWIGFPGKESVQRTVKAPAIVLALVTLAEIPTAVVGV